MYPNDFAYQRRPRSRRRCRCLQQGQQGGAEVKVLAGGQSLIPLIKLRLAEPATLVDSRERRRAARHLVRRATALLIGAMTTYFQAIRLAAGAAALPADRPGAAAGGRSAGAGARHHRRQPGARRSRRAICRRWRWRSTRRCARWGRRASAVISVTSFFIDMLTTALQPDEVLTAVTFQATDHRMTGTAYVKHRHPASGYAVVGVAAVVRLGGGRLLPGGAHRHHRRGQPCGARDERRAGVGRQAAGRRRRSAQACASAADGLDLMSDTYASAEYRAHLARVIARKAIAEAAANARG